MKKVIIITGANRGLGKALIDIALTVKNTLIFSLSRSLNDEHLKISDTKLIFIKTDLLNSFSNSTYELILQKIKSNDTIYFFNNASIILPINKIGDFKKADINRSIKVNIMHPINLINFILNKFSKNKIVLVNISSGAACSTIPFWSLYSASKAYMEAFFRVLEEENKENNKILLFNINPGVLDTGMQKNIRDNTFPNHGYFKSLKDDNKLINPEDAALSVFKAINYRL